MIINSKETIRQANAELVKEDNVCQEAIDGLRELEQLLRDFSCLMFGRDIVIAKSQECIVVFEQKRHLRSLEITMGSVISCCESACIADANTLLRKYRDDLFFCLYVFAYRGLDIDSKQALDMAPRIKEWIENKLSDVRIGQVLKDIASIPALKIAADKYELKRIFSEIGNHLNNYVHGNGYSYYNNRYNINNKQDLEGDLQCITNNAVYMTTVFFYLLVLCSPFLVTSTDIVDYLEMEHKLPEGEEYWIAPFIADFIKANSALIDEKCLEFLQENTSLKF